MNVCPDCFENHGLKRKIVSIRPTASEGNCDFHAAKKGVPIESVAQIVDVVFRELYWGGPDEGNVWLDNRGDLLVDVLYDLTGADDDDKIEAMIGALVDQDSYWPPDGEEPFYDPEYRYTLQTGTAEQHFRTWQAFRRSLMFESRFFNPDAESALHEIFHGVQQLRDANRQGPVYLIKPDTPEACFFRARVANTHEEMQQIKAGLAQELGPPPEHLRKAGRLNPSGISAFYGAFDLPTCIAELRPSVGGSIVSAQFRLTRPICVLDTTRFADRPASVNLFAAGALDRARLFEFMQMFMREIAQPVFPGEEHLEYLPTQALAEFLNRRFSILFEGERRGIDAVIFHSAQRPEGKNIVILGDAAIVGNPIALASAQPEGVPESGKPKDSGFDDWFEQELSVVRAEKLPGLLPDPDTVRWTHIKSAEFAIEDADLDVEFEL